MHELASATPEVHTIAGADLSGANLSRTRFDGADLSPLVADVSQHGATILHGASLHGAVLSGADLRGVNIAGAIGVTSEQLATAMTDAGAYPRDPD